MEAKYSKIFLMVSLWALASCSQNAISTISTVISHEEVFDFYYLLLQEDANQMYILKIDVGFGCEDRFFSEGNLSDLLNSKSLQTERLVGGGLVTIDSVITFDDIAQCYTPAEVKFVTEELTAEIKDANGNLIGLDRPENTFGVDLVDADLSSGGVINVNVFEIKVIGTTDSQTQTPGPVSLTTTEVPAVKVSGTSGVYSHTHVIPQYTEANLTDVLTNPNRFTADFAFLAKKDPAATEILLVWDGDMVLRTDL